MWGALLPKLESWIEVWGKTAFRIRTNGLLARSVEEISPGEFFFGNMLLSYILIIASALGYFALFHRGTLGEQLNLHPAATLGFFTAYFAVYLVCFLMALLATAALTYAVYDRLGSEASFRDHALVMLNLTFIEPIASVSLTWALLAMSSQSVDFGWPLLVTLLIATLLSRTWMIGAGLRPLTELHALPHGFRKRGQLAFVGSCLIFTGLVAVIHFGSLAIMVLLTD